MAVKHFYISFPCCNYHRARFYSYDIDGGTVIKDCKCGARWLVYIHMIDKIEKNIYKLNSIWRSQYKNENFNQEKILKTS